HCFPTVRSVDYSRCGTLRKPKEGEKNSLNLWVAVLVMAMGLKEPSPRHAWFLLGLLILRNVLNFVDRQLLPSLQIPPREHPDVHLSDVQNQLLAGYAFSVVYSFAGLLLGMLADRWHRPRLIACGLLVWSAMTMATGLARSFWQM